MDSLKQETKKTFYGYRVNKDSRCEESIKIQTQEQFVKFVKNYQGSYCRLCLMDAADGSILQIVDQASINSIYSLLGN